MKQHVLEIELEKIKRRDGRLHPEAVIEAARPKASALHRYFTWNNGEAADLWRLHQARNIIRVYVTIVNAGGIMEKVRAFVSLVPDRGDGGGYRVMAEVLRDPARRAQMLKDAMAELGVFQRKYRTLTELAEVFAAIDNVRAKRKAA